MAELEMKAPPRSYANIKVMGRSSIRQARRLCRQLRPQESGVSLGSRDFWGAAALSLLLLVFVLASADFDAAQAAGASANDEYAKLMGRGAKKTEDCRRAGQIGKDAWKQLAASVLRRGSNDKGIGIQLAYRSRGRRGIPARDRLRGPLGFLIACRRSCTARSIPSSRC